MKNCKILALALSVLALASCGDKAQISGTVEGAAGKQLVVKQLNMNTYSVLDTLTVKSDGSFSYNVAVKEGEPEFVYVFYGDTRVAAFLLEKGEHAKVAADTLGKYSVSGSEGSAKLQEVENSFSEFVLKMVELQDNPSAMGKAYIEHYRKSVKYVMHNIKSLTIIPVLYEQLNNLPVFGQNTDAIHFRNAADSLKTVYPKSRYVKALDNEATRREQLLFVATSIQNATETGFPNLNMPDVNGNKVSLDAVKAKAILVHFWNAEDDRQKMLAMEALLPLYKEYHKRGLEIYSVCLDPDKTSWASIVKAQNLPWINVNDGLGAMSPSISLYNLSVLPSSFLIADGELVVEQASGEAGIRKLLDKVLK